MLYPRIKFRISAVQDFKTLCAFIKDAKYDNGRNLDWSIFSKYPQLKKQFDKDEHYKIKDEKILRNFINRRYLVREKNMNRVMAQHKKRWEEIAPCFFSLVDTIFGGRTWPSGKYIAFGTIWGMYPRFLEDKTFQIPFWHRTPRYIPVVIAHELLHFMFYDYFYERYPKYYRPEDNLFVWHVSEIFNTIIQNSPIWINSFRLKSLGYPEHEKTVILIGHLFYHNDIRNLDELVDGIIKEVKSNKW